jgi:hypothetical protein
MCVVWWEVGFFKFFERPPTKGNDHRLHFPLKNIHLLYVNSHTMFFFYTYLSSQFLFLELFSGGAAAAAEEVVEEEPEEEAEAPSGGGGLFGGDDDAGGDY